jgi:hypothetical protein
MITGIQMILLVNSDMSLTIITMPCDISLHSIVDVLHEGVGISLPSIYKKSRSGSELQEVEVTSQQVEVSDIH